MGLWGATFRDEQESVLGNAVTIPCLLVGLLPAVLYFLGMVRDSIEDEFLSLVAILLIGPIACAFYFLIEQVAHRLAAIPERLTTAWSATGQSRAPQAER